VRSSFADLFEAQPTVLARAPGRVNLIGEHTDYNQGLVLPVALPHATYAALRPREDSLVRVDSLDLEESWSGDLDAVGPGTVEGFAAYAVGTLWALRESGYAVPGCDLVVHGTVPVGAGLSSSAALECSVAVGACAAVGVALDRAARDRIIAACIRAETEIAGAPTGGMDQTVAMLADAGAALLIDFESGRSESVPLELDAAGLALLVTDTRVQHALVDGGYAERRADCEAAAAELGVPSLRQASPDAVAAIADDRQRRRARHVVTEIDRVRQVVAALDAGAWGELGPILAASHASMRDDFEISCPELDLAVDTAVAAGAIGSRMTGGGFGGSSVALVPHDRVQAVTAAIDAAFAGAGFAPPAHLLAHPSGAATVVG